MITRSKIGRSRCFIAGLHRRVQRDADSLRRHRHPRLARRRSTRPLPALAAQLRDGDELIVVDNASADGSRRGRVRELAPAATVIESGAQPRLRRRLQPRRRGGVGRAALPAQPRRGPAAGLARRDRAPRASTGAAGRPGRRWSPRDGGREINTRGGVVHFTGIAWAGGAGDPLGPDDERRATDDEPGFVSGACLAIARDALPRGSAVCPSEFFLYHEDVDLSLRVRLAGGRLGVEPAALVDHGYEFDKGAAKWRYLERNRWATLIRDLPGGRCWRCWCRPCSRPSWRCSSPSRGRRLAAAEAARLRPRPSARCRVCSPSGAGSSRAPDDQRRRVRRRARRRALDSAYLGAAGRIARR